ncbi:LexA family protein [Phragmitibacter flavus]|nr:translesion error-prone DNA polymerase V autoproteolytic subunit [Phragmitibacter flavus]
MERSNKLGGKRDGAGRPRKFAQYEEPTTRIRVPVSLTDDIYRFISSDIRIPLFSSVAPAGFVSPADDFIETTFTVKELVEYFMQRPAATFLVRISGWSMKNAGINDGSIVICDRGLDPADGDVVLASVDGQVTCKRLRLEGETVVLCPDNEEFEPVIVGALSDLVVWGVVTGNFNMHRNANGSKGKGKKMSRIKMGATGSVAPSKTKKAS